MRAAAAAERRRSSAPWRSSAGVGQIGAPVVRLRCDLAVGHESGMRDPPGVDGAVLGGGAECTAWRRLGVAARRRLERIRAAKVAYGLNRLTQQRGEVGMWLTEARIERGGRAGGPAAKTGGEVDAGSWRRRCRGSSGVLGFTDRCAGFLRRCHGVRVAWTSLVAGNCRRVELTCAAETRCGAAY